MTVLLDATHLISAGIVGCFDELPVTVTLIVACDVGAVRDHKLVLSLSTALIDVEHYLPFELQREIKRRQEAKRRVLQIADERTKEAVALRQDQIVQLVRIYGGMP